jgi:hypothetical protein
VRRADRDAAFIEFVLARQTHLRRIAYAICGDWHQPDDLLQTALVKLYAAWPRWACRSERPPRSCGSARAEPVPEHHGAALHRRQALERLEQCRSLFDGHRLARSRATPLGASNGYRPCWRGSSCPIRLRAAHRSLYLPSGNTN